MHNSILGADEWQKYLDKNWDLMPNAKKTYVLPSNAELQKADNDKISREVEVLNAPTKKVKLEDVANMTKEDARLPDTPPPKSPNVNLL